MRYCKGLVAYFLKVFLLPVAQDEDPIVKKKTRVMSLMSLASRRGS
jgi:hypothetical protein